MAEERIFRTKTRCFGILNGGYSKDIILKQKNDYGKKRFYNTLDPEW